MIRVKILNLLKTFFIYLITNKSGNYKFSVNGREVIATFTDEPNKEIMSQIKEILLGNIKNSVIDVEDDAKHKKAIARDAL